jgi:UDP-glucose 4-epimerase
VFRFVSVLGERYTHGHVFDFYRELRHDPHTIEVLGNGQQRKSYLHVRDCVEAVLLGLEAAPRGFSVFNVGTDEYCTVDQSLTWICQALGLEPERRYSGGDRGWVGDNPFIFLRCDRIRKLGWRPAYSIQESVLSTLRYLKDNPWVLDARAE